MFPLGDLAAAPGLEVIPDANHTSFPERSGIYSEEIARFCELNLITRTGLGLIESTMVQA